MRILVLTISIIASTAFQHAGPSVNPQEEEETHGGAEQAEDIEADTESAKLMKEWEENMSDFVPADLVTYELGARQIEEFYEHIDVVPSKVRGAYFVSSAETSDVDVAIIDPSKEVLFRRTGKKEGIFHFDAFLPGEYLITFYNRKLVEKVSVTLALHTGNSTEEVLHKDHLTPVEQGLLEIQKSIKDFAVDQQFAQLRQETHFKTVADANRNLFWFTLLECVGIIAVTSWQAYYIKRLLDNRRII